jgi:hypothetical protein
MHSSNIVGLVLGSIRWRLKVSSHCAQTSRVLFDAASISNLNSFVVYSATAQLEQRQSKAQVPEAQVHRKVEKCQTQKVHGAKARVESRAKRIYG